MTLWQALESWLIERRGAPFSAVSLAAAIGLETWEASGMIQAYLYEQRKTNSATRFVLHRSGRTRGSVWTADDRSSVAKGLSKTLYDDTRVRVQRAFMPDLRRLAEVNPRAAKVASARIDAVADGAMKVLAAALDVDFESLDGAAV